MRKPKLSLQIPADHIVVLSSEGASDSLFFGQVSLSNVPPRCDIQITLARFGRIKRGKETKDGDPSRHFLRELGFMGPQKEQKPEPFDYATAEKLCGCLISPSQTTGGLKTTKCDFQLPIPSYLPATATLPSAEILYAVFATCVLPDRKVLQTYQELRIMRQNAEHIHLEPSRTVFYPESSFAVRASFDVPEASTKIVTIPTTLRLNGLTLPSTSSMRLNETRWLVPREIRWKLEETAVLVTGFPDATGHLPMSTTKRNIKKRNLATGREKLNLKYPFTKPGNSFVRMLSDDTGMEIPFNVTAPKDISLGDSTTLSVAGSHILHTVLSHEPTLDSTSPQKRFAIHLEYKLHIWLRIGEDIFDEESGDLVNRKMDEMAYTVLCPLTMRNVADVQQDAQDEPPPMVPPSYDGVWELPPPGYTTCG